MTSAWTPLPWDSEFFGIPIGRIDLDGRDQASIIDAEQDARRHGVVCLYGSLDPAEVALTVDVQGLGYRFVEASTTYRLDPGAPPLPTPSQVTIRPGAEADVSRLSLIIDRLAPWSRFAVDPRFGLDAARRLQEQWVRRAVSGGDGEHSLVVAEDASGPLAFVARTTRPAPVVDLFGAFAEGTGATRQLVQDARRWASKGPLLIGSIAARNVLAQRWVTGCGARLSGVRYRYHRWLDEAVVT